MSGRWLTRRAFHAAMLMRRALTLGVRGLIEDADGRILFVRHTYVEGWHFPGGGVEPRETSVEALARELREEAAVTLTAPPQLAGVFINRRLGGRDHVLLYHCPGWEMAAAFKPGIEIAEARFFSRDALPADLSRGTRRRIAELNREAEVSPEW